MNNHIIITQEQADSIRGKYGKYSAIEPVSLPDGNFLIPESILSNEDLREAWEKIPGDDPVMTLEEIRIAYPDFQKSDDVI